MRENLLALGLGLILVAVLLFVAEGWARLTLEKNTGSVVSDVDYMIADDDLGYRFRSNMRVRTKRISGDRLLYDVTYHSDGYGRRVVPRTSERPAETFVAFFGDSMTFGEGLEDHETLPAYFQAFAVSSHVYNYAFQGYGPAQALLQIEDPSLPEQIAEPRGIALYGYFDYQIHRVIGSTEMLRWSRGIFPYFSVDEDGELQHRGNFLENRAGLTRLYRLLNELVLLRKLRIEFPLVRRAHRELVCRILIESSTRFRAKFVEAEFIVMLNPLTSSNDPIVEECLAPHSIPYLDHRDLFSDVPMESGVYVGDPRTNPYHIHGDGHYSALANRKLAEVLWRELGETISKMGQNAPR